MRLTCPQCHTEYDVPDAALAGRARTLRCADCGAKFKAPALPEVVEPVLPEPLPLEAAAPETEPDAEPDASMAQMAFTEVPAEIIEPAAPALAAVRTTPAASKPTPPKPAPAPNRALGISILIVVVIIAVVLAEHRQVADAWPPSLRLFDALGLH